MRYLLAFALLLAGCLPAVGPHVDGGEGGGGGGSSAGGGANGGGGGGGGSAASCFDHLSDGDETDVDCGGSCTSCALGLKCVQPTDCQSGVCGGGHCIAPASDCGGFSACPAFDDYTAATAVRTITFGGGNDVYTPKCIKVKVGQTVTFQGNFSFHPLRQACGPIASMLQQSSGQSATFTFDQALGTYGFYCDAHGSATGGGMAGAIEVVR